ncbi:slit -like protein [Brachionus plicatilis]|uniref:Slit-like protein n=1 Tax=Brachionus plicatilis TaxID=10195 RepID=A0A3M7S567_BRAPC|nr:slit -like protein [Brachionus plicatilis]
MYAQLLISIDLENNTINSIEENSFCELKFIKLLKLSHNNLKSTSLYCLENLRFLYLSNVEYDGEIDQKKIGNPTSALLLDLSHNKIKKISLEKMARLKRLYLSSNELNDLTLDTIRAFPDLTELYISKNKFSEQVLKKFNILKNLTYLYLSNNYLSKISSSDLEENKKLYRLEVDHNQIEYVRFPSLENMGIVNLGNNKLRQINEESFSNLIYLDELYIDSNKIEKIHAKAFKFNELLFKLDLSNNFLTTTPDIRMLSFLRILNLNNNKIAILPNNPFERYQWVKINIFSKITIDLRNNNISSYSSKSFCAQGTCSLGYLGFELLLDDINQMDKCLLSQLGSDGNSKIESSLQPSCEHLLMAKYKNIHLNGDMSQCQNVSIDLEKECYSNSKFKCPKNEELVRYSTWITGDPHLYSYKNKYELCSTGQDAVCFQYGDFQLLCSDSLAGGSNQLATVLVKVKFIYQVSESVSVTYEANSTSFPDFFDNGKTIINKNVDNVAVLSNTKDGMKAIYVPKANTHIFISRWNSYYSISLRSTHETYSQSTGYLYEGCRLQDQMNAGIKKENFECDSECSNIEISAVDENFPDEVIRDACLFDCHEIGTNSTAMIKTMVENIKTFILSDSNTNAESSLTRITATITSQTKSDTTKENKGIHLIENKLLRFCMFFLTIYIFY